MDVQAELKRIREESREDFKFTMIALDNVTQSLATVTREMDLVKGKMARQEERFEMMLDVVQHQIDESVKQGEFQELRARFEALEKRIDSAA